MSQTAARSQAAQAATEPAQKAPTTVQEVATLPVSPERQRILEEGAKREGALLLYTTSTGWEAVAKAFMDRYPFVKMEIFSTRGEPLIERTLAESKAGKLGADVVKTNLSVQHDVSDLLTKFESPGAKFDRAPNAANAEITGIAFTYSKARVPVDAVPTKVEDLLAPRWKTNIGLFCPPNNYSGRWLNGLFENMGEAAATDFLRKLGDQQPYCYTQPEVARNGLLSGEWDINMQGVTSAVVSARSGDPIGWVLLDPSTLSPDVFGLFKTAPHPHAAMLLLDWAFTPEAQHFISDVTGGVTQDELDRREKEGVKLPQRITFESLQSQEKVGDYMKIFETLVLKK